ncbi:hypothetical protein AVT69_gp330 [Pseudomonas phage PhiPA3]|uniref:Uncharacterized protein 332 n=1 Tax=Pseudomonas phage PhiPA3 TaxID=998086 RepID=F8SJG8_BPPA3|nr:hypothetical protein AVT69_gp330 [Pseudomonas phage PhiPA3]AEH03755.1 hypothetical protein [Pseudomonas phage PhiPA3]
MDKRPDVKNTSMCLVQYSGKCMMDWWINRRLCQELCEVLHVSLKRLDTLFQIVEDSDDALYDKLRDELLFFSGSYKELMDLLFRYQGLYKSRHMDLAVLAIDSIIGITADIHYKDECYGSEFH